MGAADRLGGEARAGIVDFRERMLPQYAQRFKELALAPEPDALFITCADSRVVPDLLASTLPGDLFTMRNDSSLKPHDQLSQFNVLVQLEHLDVVPDRSVEGSGWRASSEWLVV